jgi:hypothetical protein
MKSSCNANERGEKGFEAPTVLVREKEREAPKSLVR